mmetsp:Transcript_31641/g.50903  ORF Transcript_31641/g.50903 Transcript_31641/m.50903 type:complete len:804 (-) Transcript_31641:207-2618(-)
MDASPGVTNKDIAVRQNLLHVAGKNTLPPQHIIQQQRQSTQHELSTATRKIIALKHKELCPLCHRPSFIFNQYEKPPPTASSSTASASLSPSVCPGTFMCAKCSNQAIQSKLSQIIELKQDIKRQTQLIQPILTQKVNTRNTKYLDKTLRSKQHQQRISNLRHSILQRQKENKLLKLKNEALRDQTRKRKYNLHHISPKLSQKWQYALDEYARKSQLYHTKHASHRKLSTQISLKLLLQMADFYKMKVLPIMHVRGNEHEQQQKLSMIQNIAIPSVFKIRAIRSFYNDAKNESFRFPLPTLNNRHPPHIQIKATQIIHPRPLPLSPPPLPPTSPPTPHTHKQYSVPLKSPQNAPSSPLQRYSQRLTTSISNLSAQMSVSFLTPPGLKRHLPSHGYHHAATLSGTASRSLPKNLDDLVLPPAFFSDDETASTENGPVLPSKGHRTMSSKDMQKIPYSSVRVANKAMLDGRGRSQSLDALKKPSISLKKLIHEPHIEHGICAALQYIVSFVLHASKYLHIELLYKMGLYCKNKRGKFVMHTYIERKGKPYRLYWICQSDKEDLAEHPEEPEENDDDDDDDDDHEEEEKKQATVSRVQQQQDTKKRRHRQSAPLSLTEVSEQHRKKQKKSSSKYSKTPSHQHRREYGRGGGNILEFEHALHLLEENINDFCVQCGVKSSKLHYFQYIANLNTLLKHLETKYTPPNDGNMTANTKSNHSNIRPVPSSSASTRKHVPTHKRIEPLNIIPNYGLGSNGNGGHLLRVHSASNSISSSLSESITVNNSESDIVVSPTADLEHEDWDLVDFT